MSSDSQINANRENAQASTGPRTPEGKAISSRNHLTLGLYTRRDYVKPDERELYKQFCEAMTADLAPLGLLEESCAAEVTRANWRLHRCANAEGELADYAETDPFLSAGAERTIRSIERARSAAQLAVTRALTQLRKLQTERLTREQSKATAIDHVPLADSRKATSPAASPGPRTKLGSICNTYNTGEPRTERRKGWNPITGEGWPLGCYPDEKKAV